MSSVSNFNPVCHKPISVTSCRKFHCPPSKKFQEIARARNPGSKWSYGCVPRPNSERQCLQVGSTRCSATMRSRQRHFSLNHRVWYIHMVFMWTLLNLPTRLLSICAVSSLRSPSEVQLKSIGLTSLQVVTKGMVQTEMFSTIGFCYIVLDSHRPVTLRTERLFWQLRRSECKCHVSNKCQRVWKSQLHGARIFAPHGSMRGSCQI